MTTKRERRNFESEFKIQAVKLLIDSKRPATSVARDLDIHVNVLQRWKREYLEEQTHAFPGKGNLMLEQSQIKALQRELRDVKEERDILKKAVAIFSKSPK